MSGTALPLPEPEDEVRWVGRHLGHLCSDEPARSGRFVGTQAAADAALDALDLHGYARRRNEVQPPSRRGATALSPWIRHGLLTLPRVWEATAEAPAADRRKFRDELRWQEYARHLYARLGHRTAAPLRRSIEPAPTDRDPVDPERPATGPWDRSMRCVEINLDELERDGWMVNQTRMWLASQWSVRHRADWRVGEDHFFRHLLDGSRAANRLGWQWTTGSGTSKAYGFSRWQVRRRAPGLCDTCEHRHSCPIEDWPDDPPFVAVERDPLLRRDTDVDRTAGPETVHADSAPDAAWLTAESLGDDDPALSTNPGLPAVFVFDEALLGRLRLSSKRLVFLVDRLAELGVQRPLEIHLGNPVEVLAGRPLATTFAPVPGWRSRAASLDIAELHPWPWLERPRPGSIASFSAWAKGR